MVDSTSNQNITLAEPEEGVNNAIEITPGSQLTFDFNPKLVAYELTDDGDLLLTFKNGGGYTFKGFAELEGDVNVSVNGYVVSMSELLLNVAGIARAGGEGRKTLTSGQQGLEEGFGDVLGDVVDNLKALANVSEVDVSELPDTTDDVLTVDITPPIIDPIDLSTPSDSGTFNDDNLTNITNPVFTGTSEPLAVISLFADDVLLGTTRADDEGNWEFESPELDEGVYDITATATDANENTSDPTPPLSVEIDLTTPATPDITFADNQDGNAAYLNAEEVIDDGTPTTSTVNVLVPGGSQAGDTLVITYNDINGVEQTLLAVLSATQVIEGVNIEVEAIGEFGLTVTARAFDPAGNEGGTATSSILVDTIPPDAPVINLQVDSRFEDDDYTNDGHLTFTGEADSVLNFTIVDDLGNNIATPSQPPMINGEFTFDMNSLQDGTYTVVATLTDAAGNTSNPQTFNYTLDQTNPDLVTINKTLPEISDDMQYEPSLGLFVEQLQTNEPNVTYEIVGGNDNNWFTLTSDGALSVTEAGVNAGIMNFEQTDLGNGRTISIQTTDQAGNTSVGDYTLNVANVNEKPTAIDTATYNNGVEDQPLVVTRAELLADLNIDDAEDGQYVILNITSTDSNIKSIVYDQNSEEFTIIPKQNFYGDVKLKVSVEDQDGAFIQRTITANFDPANDIPTADLTAHFDAGVEDQTLYITRADLISSLNINDVEDGQNIILDLTATDSNIQSITYDAVNEQYVIEPVENFNGDVLFSLSIEDQDGASIQRTITANFDPRNDVPAADLTVHFDTGVEDQTLYITRADLISSLNINDVEDGQNVILNLTTSDSNIQSITYDAVNEQYVIELVENFNGDVPFDLTIEDQDGASIQRTITANFDPRNDVPTADLTAHFGTGVEDQTLYITRADLISSLNINDVEDGQDVILNLTTTDSNIQSITYDAVNEQYVIEPVENFNGDAQFNLSIEDQDGASIQRTITANFDPRNDVPTGEDALIDTINEDTTVPVTFTAASLISDMNFDDVDGDNLTLTYTPNLAQVGVVTYQDGGELTVVLQSGDEINVNTTYSFIPATNEDSDFVFDITATDPSGASVTQKATIDVLPVNDPPTLVIDPITILEDIPTDTVVAHAVASDIDSTNLTFSFADGSLEKNGFVIDPNTGEIKVTAGGPFNDAGEPFDIDAPTTSDTITLDVKVDDNDGAFTTQQFVVTIQDSNDNPVIFDPAQNNDGSPAPNYAFTITEADAAVGTITATDIDRTAGDITYSLENTDGSPVNCFAIDQSGNIVVTDPNVVDVDANSANALQTLVVRAASEDGSASTQQITISVQDINDNLVIFDPAQNNDGSPAPNYAFTITEADTAVGTITATDIDRTAGDITYSLEKTDGSPANGFAIDQSGNIVVTDPNVVDVDANSANALQTLVVRAASEDGSVSTQQVTISVQDINDNLVIFDPAQNNDGTPAPNYMFTMDETEDVVGTITAQDADISAGDITYSLESTDGKPLDGFAIDQNGNITITDPNAVELDPDGLNEFQTFVVRAQSEDGSEGTQTVQLTVQPVNEHALDFTDSTVQPVVIEETVNQEDGTRVVTQVEASDFDYTENVTYELLNHTDKFEINAQTGEITVKESVILNNEDSATFAPLGTAYEANGIYTLTDPAAFQIGAVWSNQTLDLMKDFSITADLFLGLSDGADGMTFMLHPEVVDPADTSSGSYLGANIENAVVVEFDTYHTLVFNDPWENHISIHTDGDLQHGSDYSQAIQTPNLEDGLWHEATFSWDASAEVFTVSFEGQTATLTGGLTQHLANSTNVHFGFTGATGAAVNLQQVNIKSIEGIDTSYNLQVQATSVDSDPTTPNEVITTTIPITITSADNPTTGTIEIQGAAEVGNTLTADISNLIDPDGEIIAHYQWYHGEGDEKIAIDEATGSDYTLTAEDANHQITVEVSAADTDGSPQTFSDNTTYVAASPEFQGFSQSHELLLNGDFEDGSVHWTNDYGEVELQQIGSEIWGDSNDGTPGDKFVELSADNWLYNNLKQTVTVDPDSESLTLMFDYKARPDAWITQQFSVYLGGVLIAENLVSGSTWQTFEITIPVSQLGLDDSREVTLEFFENTNLTTGVMLDDISLTENLQVPTSIIHVDNDITQGETIASIVDFDDSATYTLTNSDGSISEDLAINERGQISPLVSGGDLPSGLTELNLTITDGEGQSSTVDVFVTKDTIDDIIYSSSGDFDDEPVVLDGNAVNDETGINDATDRFHIEGNNEVVIINFDATQGDTLDISSVLDGTSEPIDLSTSNIEQYVDISGGNGNFTITVKAETPDAPEQIITIQDATGLDDQAALIQMLLQNN